MLVHLLKSKIHMAAITRCDLEYEGSLAIDQDIMEAVDLLPFEKILVVNATNGERLETYAIPEARGSRIFCLNGAAARRGARGDRITIMAFASSSLEEARAHLPKIVVLDQHNQVVARKGALGEGT